MRKANIEKWECAYKWMFAACVLSLIAQLFTATTMLVMYGNENMPRWAEMWVGITLLGFLVAGVVAIVAHFKDVKIFVCDNLC